MKKQISLFLLFFLALGSIYCQESSFLRIHDTRNVNDLPNFNQKGLRLDFKERSIIDVPGLGGYSTNLTLSPWTDNTGGLNHQLNFNDGGLYYRQGDFDKATWDSWSKVFLTESDGTIREGIRIGKIGEAGNIDVELGAKSIQYNIDFTGYRDIRQDQIGARISAVRYNHLATNASLIQKTGLVFYTNPLGHNSGTIDLKERMCISPEGHVGIGTSNPENQLEVKGKIRAEEVIIETGWADFVFDKDYHLRTLQDVENHINAYKHLPDIPSAKEVEENGVSLGEMQAKLLQKIEELTLYVIEQSKEIIQIKEENIKLKERLDTLIDTQ